MKPANEEMAKQIGDTDELSGSAAGFGIALAAASVASALLVIVKEESPHGVMPWMARITGHHWATHSLFAVVIFLGVGFGLSRTNGGCGPRLSGASVSRLLMAGILVSSAIIVGFYLFAD